MLEESELQQVQNVSTAPSGDRSIKVTQQNFAIPETMVVANLKVDHRHCEHSHITCDKT